MIETPLEETAQKTDENRNQALLSMILPAEKGSREKPGLLSRIAGVGGDGGASFAGVFAAIGAPVRPILRSERLSRALNVTVASVALIIHAPLLILIAVAIKLTSPGPILYSQVRIGVDRRRGRSAPPDCKRVVDYGGKPFKIYKFRTMRHTPRAAEEQVWAAPNDPRVTAVGKVLRKLRFDELPQLFNVLRGDMNIVGPRPEQPEIFLDLRERIQGYEGRQAVLPGITGWAQVNHHYDRTLEDVQQKLNYDLEYISRRSVLHDLGIMLRTLPTILFQRGAW